jgi:type IV secretory pathway VirB4 component
LIQIRSLTQMPKTEMQSGQLAGNKPHASTQAFLDIAEIKEGVVILRDGSLRAVVVVSATNFSLKSAEEQNALIGSYQSLLNSLDFPIQILMQSRRLDINSYLEKMRGIMQQQTNELLRLQTQEYIEYISKLIEFASIMNKTFYVIVPYSVEAVKSGFFDRLGSMFNPAGNIKLKKEDFERHRETLMQRTDQVSSELAGMGLRTITLNTEELVELMYNSYNLNTASPIRIKNIDELEMVHARDDEEAGK